MYFKVKILLDYFNYLSVIKGTMIKVYGFGGFLFC